MSPDGVGVSASALLIRAPRFNALLTGVDQVTSVNMVEIRCLSEVATGQAALGGSVRGSASASGAVSSAMASSCM